MTNSMSYDIRSCLGGYQGHGGSSGMLCTIGFKDTLVARRFNRQGKQGQYQFLVECTLDDDGPAKVLNRLEDALTLCRYL